MASRHLYQHSQSFGSAAPPPVHAAPSFPNNNSIRYPNQAVERLLPVDRHGAIPRSQKQRTPTKPSINPAHLSSLVRPTDKCLMTRDHGLRRKTDVEHLLEIYETEAKRVKYRQEWELEQEKQKEWQRTGKTATEIPVIPTTEELDAYIAGLDKDELSKKRRRGGVVVHHDATNQTLTTSTALAASTTSTALSSPSGSTAFLHGLPGAPGPIYTLFPVASPSTDVAPRPMLNDQLFVDAVDPAETSFQFTFTVPTASAPIATAQHFTGDAAALLNATTPSFVGAPCATVKAAATSFSTADAQPLVSPTHGPIIPVATSFPAYGIYRSSAPSPTSTSPAASSDGDDDLLAELEEGLAKADDTPPTSPEEDTRGADYHEAKSHSDEDEAARPNKRPRYHERAPAVKHIFAGPSEHTWPRANEDYERIPSALRNEILPDSPRRVKAQRWLKADAHRA